MKDLEKIRSQIDWIDRDIMAGLDKRFELVERIREIKIQNGMSILDKSREDIIHHYIELSTKYENEIKAIYEEIMKQSRNLQDE
ncbi:MAG: chorismate mutase [Bacilli bacterium]